MLLTGHKSRAIFDRYNIIHEQELLDAGDQLVEYLAQQAQAGPARQRPHPAGPAALPRVGSSPIDRERLWSTKLGHSIEHVARKHRFDSLRLPSGLATTHAALDRAVDRCYRPKLFASDRERVEHLLRLFEQLYRPLTPAPSRVKRRGSRRSASHKP